MPAKYDGEVFLVSLKLSFAIWMYLVHVFPFLCPITTFLLDIVRPSPCFSVLRSSNIPCFMRSQLQCHHDQELVKGCTGCFGTHW